MKILVTGGAGFIGSHLADRLLRQGHEVLILDNFTTGRVENLPELKHQLLRADCRWPITSYVDEKLVQECDFIYHLAATVGVKRVLDDPRECIDNNIEGTREILGLGIPGIFVSTSEVYGKTSEPLCEDSPVILSTAPRWCYAASKLIGEWMALDKKWRVVRLFNTVGPRQSTEYGAVLPRFVRQAIKGEQLTVHGDGRQVRTFIDVRDCVEVLDRLRGENFDVVNVGGHRVTDMKTLATQVRDILDSSSEIVLVPYAKAYPPGYEDCACRIPTLGKLSNLLSGRQFVHFEKTILDLAEDIKCRDSLPMIQ